MIKYMFITQTPVYLPFNHKEGHRGAQRQKKNTGL